MFGETKTGKRKRDLIPEDRDNIPTVIDCRDELVEFPIQIQSMKFTPSIIATAKSRNLMVQYQQSNNRVYTARCYDKIQYGRSKKAKVGKDQKKAQSERDAHSKNQGGKKKQKN